MIIRSSLKTFPCVREIHTYTHEELIQGEEMPLLFNVARMYNCDQTIYSIQGKCGDSDTCPVVSCEHGKMIN